MSVVGGNANPQVTGVEEASGKSNYFLGKDPKKWRTGMRNYSKVKYSQIYPGVDLVYHCRAQQLEYDFVVAPGADPKNIRMEFKGAVKLEVDTRGDLVLHTPGGEIRHRKPLIYQEVNGEESQVSGGYVLRGKREVGFEVADYDRTKAVVIDPVIAYSTLLGRGGGGELASWANGIATHTAADGNVYVYVVGITTQTDFPIRNAIQPAFAGIGTAPWAGDVFVAKFNMAASGDASLVYSTYLGGSSNDFGAGIAVDSAGNAYVTGLTSSIDFPISKAAQSSSAGGDDRPGGGFPSDAFVTALSVDGSSLIYSTYLGGTDTDAASSVAVDLAGNAYITGSTNSVDFPVVNAYQPPPQQPITQGFIAAFVAKIAPPAGSNPASLVYSTYLGGNNESTGTAEGGNGIAVDSAGNAYVTGVTGSSNFPVVNGFQTELRCIYGNVFVAKLNPSASGSASLLYSTYLGGSCRGVGGDTGNGIAVDSAGNAYVTGVTISNDLPTTPGAFMRSRRTSGTAFVAKVDPSKSGASSLIYSTLLGGTSFNAPEGATSIAVDGNGNAYVTGDTDSFDFPLVNATQSFNSGVFQSINGGMSWAGINKGLTVPSVTAMAIDQSTTPRTLYAGAGGGYSDVVGGVFKSTDGGSNWTAISTGLTNIDIKSLLISPVDPSVIYAATGGGVSRSTDGGGSWSPFNAGLSSEALTSINTLVADANTINGTTTVKIYAGATAGLYQTVEGTSGWSSTGNSQPVWIVAVDPKTSPHTLYTSDVAGGTSTYKSFDGGANWTALQSPLYGFDAIAVDISTTPSTLYAVDKLAFAYSDGPALWKSTDGGSSWLGIEFPLDLVGYDRTTILIDHKTTPSTVYIHNIGGGIISSTDGGATWTHVFNRGVAAVQADSASTSSPSPLYVGTYFPTPDAFVAELNPTGSALVFSTILGGYGSDFGSGIALDSSGNIYVAGKTQQGPFPTANAYQATSRGGSDGIDAFVVKLGSAALPSTSTGSVTSQMAVQTGTLELSFPNITGSTSGTSPTATVDPLDSTTTANLTLSNNLGAYEIKTTATYNTSGYATDPTKGIKLTFNVQVVNDLNVFNGLVITHGEDSNGDGIIQSNEMIPYNGSVNANKVTYHDFATRAVWVYLPSLSPFIITKGAADQVNDLIRLVKSLNLQKGIANSLDAKLQNAQDALTAARSGNRSSACNLMASFISEAQAQSGKALTVAEAKQLGSAANQIRAVLGCH
jgi:photosystem II stability/assembly factor-like uncharacterized protein